MKPELGLYEKRGGECFLVMEIQVLPSDWKEAEQVDYFLVAG
jgi:hypothetical protein